jgi:hypothetical protein
VAAFRVGVGQTLWPGATVAGVSGSLDDTVVASCVTGVNRTFDQCVVDGCEHRQPSV